MRWLILFLAPTLAFANPNYSTRSNNSTPEERWLNVRLNHMMASNTDTFPLRFFYNPMSPTADNVVMLLAGDWEITEEGADEGTLAWNIASNIDAALFYVEHRYYGKSTPFDDTSITNLRFLTIDQALGDIAQLIQHIKSDDFEKGRFKSAKVVLISCAYGGSLATWTRLVYPHLVQAVVSDSAPLYAKEDLPEYLSVVNDLLRVKGSEQCYNSVQQAMQEVMEALNTTVGAPQVSQMFNTCAQLSANSPLETAVFWWKIWDALTTLVRLLNMNQLSAACTTLTTPATASAMQRLATWYTEQSQEPCFEARYTNIVAKFANTSSDSPQMQDRLQMFRWCSQLGWWRTYFPHLPAQFYQQLCTDVFSDHFNRDFLRAGISRTNLFFAGISHLPDYVVSVSSTLDPYFIVSADPFYSTSKAPVYILHNEARCTALGAYENSPTEEIRQVKLNVMNDIQYFIHGVPFAGATRVLSSIVLVIGVIIAFTM